MEGERKRGGEEKMSGNTEKARERVTNECKKGIQNKEGGKQI